MLQATEIFPTCVRSSGLGCVQFCVKIFGLAGPHITALGAKDKRLPFVPMGLLNLFAAVASFFLPETVGCSLPETLQEASDFGKDQRYFSFVKNGKVYNRSGEENVSETHV